MIAEIKSEVRRVVVILENRERRIEKKQHIWQRQSCEKLKLVKWTAIQELKNQL